MELEFDEEQEELRGAVRRVLERECPIGLARQVAEKGTGAEGFWQRVRDLHWPALTVPEDNGGTGLGMVELGVLMEETGAVVAPVPLFSTLGLFVPAVREAGTPDQRERFLRPVADGRMAGTLAGPDDGGCWDPARVNALARRDGQDWVLSGTKHYVIDAAAAAEVVAACRVGSPDGPIGLFVLPGESLRPAGLRSPDRTRPLSRLPLEGVRVGPDRLLGGEASIGGGPGGSEAALQRALEEGTVALTAEMVGTCSSILAIALDHAKNRVQFGVRIGSFQAMKHKLADMYVALEAARATTYFALAAVAEDDPRRSIAAAMAKALAGDCQRRVCQDGIQSMGGIGYTWEHDMHLYVKRAMGSAALLGTAEHHRDRVGALLGIGGMETPAA